MNETRIRSPYPIVTPVAAATTTGQQHRSSGGGFAALLSVAMQGGEAADDAVPAQGPVGRSVAVRGPTIIDGIVFPAPLPR